MPKGRRKGISKRSSSPGEAPAVQTGQLLNSLQVVESAKLERTISANAPHAPYLEFGTSRMAPRPYLRPALRNVMGESAEKIIAAQLSGALK